MYNQTHRIRAIRICKALTIVFCITFALLIFAQVGAAAVFADSAVEEVEEETMRDLVEEDELSGAGKIVYKILSVWMRGMIEGIYTIKFALIGKISDIIMQNGSNYSRESYYSFNFNQGNIYGLISAIAYSVIRGVAYVILSAELIYAIVQSIVGVSTGGKAAELKETILSIVFGFIILAIMPTLMTYAFEMRNGFTSAIITGVYGEDSVEFETAIKSVCDNYIFFGFFLYIAYTVFCFKLALDYVFVCVSCVVGMFAFPFCVILGPRSIKSRLQNWSSIMIGNLITPVIDTLLLAIPAMIMRGSGVDAGSMGNDFIHFNYLARLFAIIASCWAIQPARQWFLKWVGVADSGALGQTARLAGLAKDAFHKGKEVLGKNKEDKEAAAEHDAKADAQDAMDNAQNGGGNETAGNGNGANINPASLEENSKTIEQSGSNSSNEDSVSSDDPKAAVNPVDDAKEAANGEPIDASKFEGFDTQNIDNQSGADADDKSAEKSAEKNDSKSGKHTDSAHKAGNKEKSGSEAEPVPVKPPVDGKSAKAEDTDSDSTDNSSVNKTDETSTADNEVSDDQEPPDGTIVSEAERKSFEGADSEDAEQAEQSAPQEQVKNPSSAGQGAEAGVGADSKHSGKEKKEGKGVPGLGADISGYGGFEAGELPTTQEGLVEAQEQLEAQDRQARSDTAILKASRDALKGERGRLREEQQAEDNLYAAQEKGLNEQIADANVEAKQAALDTSPAGKERKAKADLTKAMLEKDLRGVQAEREKMNAGYDRRVGDIDRRISACDAGILDGETQSAAIEEETKAVQSARQALSEAQGQKYVSSAEGARAQLTRNQALADTANLDNFEQKDIYAALSPKQRAEFHRQKAAALRQGARSRTIGAVAVGAAGVMAGSMAGVEGSSLGLEVGATVGESTGVEGALWATAAPIMATAKVARSKPVKATAHQVGKTVGKALGAGQTVVDGSYESVDGSGSSEVYESTAGGNTSIGSTVNESTASGNTTPVGNSTAESRSSAGGSGNGTYKVNTGSRSRSASGGGTANDIPDRVPSGVQTAGRRYASGATQSKAIRSPYQSAVSRVSEAALQNVEFSRKEAERQETRYKEAMERQKASYEKLKQRLGGTSGSGPASGSGSSSGGGSSYSADSYRSFSSLPFEGMDDTRIENLAAAIESSHYMYGANGHQRPLEARQAKSMLAGSREILKGVEFARDGSFKFDGKSYTDAGTCLRDVLKDNTRMQHYYSNFERGQIYSRQKPHNRNAGFEREAAVADISDFIRIFKSELEKDSSDR